jgi:nucleolar protein 53
MLNAINSAKQLRRSTYRALTAREKARAERQRVLQQKAKLGLAGQKVGKHKVPKGEVDVQLGEELSESLRGLKVRLRVFC